MNKKFFWGLCLALLATGCVEPESNTTPPVTDPGADQPVCQNGKRQCNALGTSVDVCKAGQWVVEQPCPIPMVCHEAALQCRNPDDDSPVGKVCEEGTRQCFPGNTAIVKCVKSDTGVESWAMEQFCAETESCNPQTVACEPVAQCTEGAKQCSADAKGVMTCSDGAWTLEKTCESNETCDAATSSCKTQNTSSDYVCSDWTRKCENGNVWTCQNNAWVETQVCGEGKTCSDALLDCVTDKPAPVCTEGVTQCDTDGSRVLQCKNGVWTVQESCSGTQSCDPVALSCKDGCMSGAFKCDGNTLKECKQSDWTTAQECTGGKTCDADNGICAEPFVCSPGSVRCNNTETGIEVCSNNAWVKGETCGAGYQCIAGSCIPGTACSGDGSRCDNGDIVSCVNGAEITTDCGSKDCIMRNGNAVCETYVCDDGDKQCTDNKTLQTCENNAYTTTTCASNEHCDGAKGCVITVCNEGQKRCNQNNVEKCANNAWVIDRSCGSNQMCNSSTNKCVNVVCETGEKRCDGNTVDICQNNAFKTETTCKSTEFCKESGTSASCITKVCTENDYKCDGAKLMICEDNAWKTSKTCSAANLCNASNGTCDTQVCTEGATKCSGSKKSVMICEGNAWKTKEACYTTGAKCEASGSSYICKTEEPWVCDDGATCNGNTLKVCQNNAYILEKTCLASETCNATTKSCDPKPECTPNTYKCTGSSLYKCSATGFWGTTANKTCTGYEVCDATLGQCVDTSVCTDGTYYCDGSKLQKCAGGQWTTEKECNASLETCNASAKKCDLKPVCTSGEVSCNGLTLRECVGGQWTNKITCTGGKTCSATLAKCIECNDGDKQCSEDGKSTMVCDKGTWKTTACTGASYCSESLNKCIECETGEYRCNGSQLQNCSANKWTTSKTCNSTTEYCDASNKTCVLKDVCTTGDYLCDGQNLKECKSGQWTSKDTCSADENCDATAKTCVLKPVCTPSAKRCNANVFETCDAAGQWNVTQDCGESAICMTTGSLTECVDKMTLPTWCNIQGVDAHAKGYGRVLMPSDVELSDISAQFVCGSTDTPVMSWTYASDALHNNSCTNCYSNTEYMSFSLDAPAGTYACTYVFEFGPESIACLPKTGNSDGGAPIVLNADTKLNTEQTMPMTVPTASTEAPAWCHFKHLDTENIEGYGRIYLPGATTPAQVKAMLICGDITQPAATWTHNSNAIQNLFCSDCGNNVEFASNPMTLGAGNWSCAFRFDVSGKSYVCPTNGNNGTPVELTSSTILTDATSWGFTK